MKVKVITNLYRYKVEYTLKVMSGYREGQIIEGCKFTKRQQALLWCQAIGYEVIE